ncbi:MAG TPA: hypothetical protein VL418_08475 [Devosiaceae bacterium]|nr:hypothetical protein [Devosiaceae bacterium]
MAFPLAQFLRNPAGAAAAILGTTGLVLAMFRLTDNRLPALPPQVDPGVVALFVPLCVLVIAVVVEAILFTERHKLARESAPAVRPLSHWADGDR